jgi:hypothetical protein
MPFMGVRTIFFRPTFFFEPSRQGPQKSSKTARFRAFLGGQKTRGGLKITPISRNSKLEAAFGPPLTHGTLWYGRGYVDFEL